MDIREENHEILEKENSFLILPNVISIPSAENNAENFTGYSDIKWYQYSLDWRKSIWHTEGASISTKDTRRMEITGMYASLIGRQESSLMQRA